MTKKKVILLAAAALFAVSGLTALPSGNITGGVGCIVVAAVCAYFGLKKKSAGKENGNRTPAPAAASGGRILPFQTSLIKICEAKPVRRC